VQEIVLDQGVVRAVREKSGELELLRLSKKKAPDAAAAPAPAVPAPTVATTPTRPTKGWTATLGRFALQQWAVSWADQALEYPVAAKLDQLDLELTKLRWPLEGAIDTKLGFRWMESGRLAISGPLSPEPLGGELHVELTDFSLVPFDGYLWEYALNGTLKSGALTTRLDATFADGGKQYTARGDVAFRQLNLLDGDDKPLLEARALELSGLDVRSSPALTVSLGAVKLAGTTLRVERDGAGEVNLSKLAKAKKSSTTPAPTAPAEKSSGGGLTAKVATVQLEDLNVDWLDRTTKPAFATSVKRLSGKISNVTSPTTQRIGLALGGRLDQAPFSVKGAILPRGKASDGAIKLSLTGYDLPRATPYSVQYVSQPIARGKIGVELDWKLGGRKVTAANRVLVDQLDFGPVVEEPGPDAKQLPLGLAVAVLSDRKGRIDLELPMSGDLDDPEFQWGGMILFTLKNLLEKVATAPFTLVAGLFAGDPESLKAIVFPAGEASPVSDEAAKAETLATLLTERPLLKLELAPGVDPVADRDVLARRQLRQSLTPRGGVALERSDAGVPGLDDAEYQRLVGVAWRKVHGADAGTVEFQRMESELLARQVVSEEALEGLRRQRAAWLQSSLGDRGVDVTRLFVVGTAQQEAANVAVQLK
jgi:hypothetical protein